MPSSAEVICLFDRAPNFSARLCCLMVPRPGVCVGWKSCNFGVRTDEEEINTH